MFRKSRFIKKKPVRGFRDLEIYQAWKKWGEENPSGFSKNYTR